MSHRRTWEPPQPTRLRKILDYLTRQRYRLLYLQRIREFKSSRRDVRDCPISRQMVREIRSYWAGFGINYVNTDWYKVFTTLTGKFDPRFIPEETFRVELEGWLNNASLANAYADKNLIDQRFPQVVRPETLLRSMHGQYYDAAYRPLDRTQAVALLAGLSGAFIVKPAVDNTGSGQNVNLIEIENGTIRADGQELSLADIERTYGTNFLVQRKLVQHASMSAYHHRSFNTCRIITLRLDGELNVIATTFRMGNGSHVDNAHAGGVVCGVDVASGRLTPYALDVRLHAHDTHPVSGFRFAGQQIHHYDKMKAMAIDLHRQLTYFDMISFDIGLREDGEPCLVEINLFGQTIEPFQSLKGGPLFGDETDRVLEVVANRRKRVWTHR